MIGILTRRKSFLIWDVNLVIDVANFLFERAPACTSMALGFIVARTLKAVRSLSFYNGYCRWRWRVVSGEVLY